MRKEGIIRREVVDKSTSEGKGDGHEREKGPDGEKRQRENRSEGKGTGNESRSSYRAVAASGRAVNLRWHPSCVVEQLNQHREVLS